MRRTGIRRRDEDLGWGSSGIDMLKIGAIEPTMGIEP